MGPDHVASRKYRVFEPIGSGGAGCVHLGELVGPLGFRRTVAIKRLHADIAGNPEFVAMLLDEARLSSRIRHQAVVPVLDVIAENGNVLLVLEYVDGLPLSWLRSPVAQTRVGASGLAVAIVAQLLDGLQAVHDARDERGDPLKIVHRDVSPHNVIVGSDGGVRLLDLGVAKAEWRRQVTRQGEMKGKPQYMSPEQLTGGLLDGRADIFSVGVLLWELLTGRRMHATDAVDAVLARIAEGPVALCAGGPDPGTGLTEVLHRALAYDAERRFATATEMAHALRAAVAEASRRDLATWVEQVGRDTLAERRALVRRFESDPAAAPSAVLDGEETTTIRGRLGSASGEATLGGVRASVQRRAERIRPLALLLPALAGATVALAALGPLTSWWDVRAPAYREDGKDLAAPANLAAPPTSGTAAHDPATRPPVPTPAASTSGAASAPGAAAAPPTPAPTVPHQSYRARPAATADDCDPPYVVDDGGVRTYKEHCL